MPKRAGLNSIGEDIPLSIGEVAKILNLSPGLIRTWERERLFKPDRTAGGHRQFRSEHLKKLRQIAKLYCDDGLNPAAIRRELGMSTSEVTIIATPDTGIGARLRRLRAEKGLTLAETAEASGLSASFISALERGNTGVSLAALFRLAEALGTTIPMLRGEDFAPGEKHMTRANERPRFSTDDGRLVIEDIVSRPAGMEAQISYIAPGTNSGSAWSHHGQEFLHVLSGELVITLFPDERYVLGRGDTLYFQSHIQHSWSNESQDETMVLWVNAPLPSDAKTIAEPHSVELKGNGEA
jgi:transcriptional regulator with XRE-family HTH domain